MHESAFNYVRDQVKAHGPFNRVVEIGSRNVNGSVKPLFGDCDYTGVDALDGPGVDVVCDGAAYFPINRPDCVVCCETLEHDPDPEALIANMRAMLAPGGVLILTMAGPGRAPHSAIDGHPLSDDDDEYYANIDPDDLQSWLAGMRTVEIRPVPALGDLYAVAKQP